MANEAPIGSSITGAQTQSVVTTTTPAATACILEVQHLVKAFGGLRAVDDCSFTVARGSIAGLIGPNGAGKSTAANLITGFLRTDAGTVLFDGANIARLPIHRIAQRGLTRTFQITRELERMTVTENLLAAPHHQLGESFWLGLLSTPATEPLGSRTSKPIYNSLFRKPNRSLFKKRVSAEKWPNLN